MIQYSVPQSAESCFLDGRVPRLCYFCCVDGERAWLPRAMHVHPDCAELVFLCEGAGVHMIGDHMYATRAGDVLIYNAGVPHEERMDEHGAFKYYTLGITGLRLRGLPENVILDGQFVPVLNAGEEAAHLRELCSILQEQMEKKHMLSGELCRHLMLAVLLTVLELAWTAAAPYTGRENLLGLRIKHYIDAHYREKITLSSISERLGVSTYYLGRLLKEKTGYSPMQYIINRRMGEAQTLLITGDEAVTRIAERVGYDNPNYFSMLFKKNIGVTPGQYRRITHELAHKRNTL